MKIIIGIVIFCNLIDAFCAVLGMPPLKHGMVYLQVDVAMLAYCVLRMNSGGSL